jgi:multiple sugar transport system permease protein
MTDVTARIPGHRPLGLARSQRLDKPRFNPVSLLLLSPTIVLLAALFVLPIGYAIYLGFTNLQLIGPHSVNYSFTGYQNVGVLLSDDVFFRSIWLTLIFVVGSGAVGTTLLGLVCAIAMQNCIPAVRLVVSGLAIVAWTLPPTTIAIIWYAASTTGGIVPMMLAHPSYDLLYDQAMLIVSIANSWSLAGLAMIMFSAALKNIPTDIDEAAMLENASSWQRLMRLTVPLLKPTILTSALLMTLLSFGNFTLIYLMTAGGPSNDTNILPVYSYLQGFQFHRLGYAALLGNAIVVLSALVGAFFVFVAKNRR